MNPSGRREQDLIRRRAHIVRRLNLLEQQRAQKGIDTPPEVINEIEDLEADIRRLDRSIAEVQDALVAPAPDTTPAGLYDLFVALREDVYRANLLLYKELLQIRNPIKDLQLLQEQVKGASEDIWRMRVRVRHMVAWIAVLTALVLFNIFLSITR